MQKTKKLMNQNQNSLKLNLHTREKHQIKNKFNKFRKNWIQLYNNQN